MEQFDHLATSILKQGYWNRLGNLRKSLDPLPPDIEEMYNEIKERAAIRLNAESRLMSCQAQSRRAGASRLSHLMLTLEYAPFQT
jgi:hypothetical protein